MPQSLPEWAAEQLARLEARIAHLERAPRLANSSIDDGSINVKDEDERVREVIGRQPDGSHGSRVVLSPAQPTPTAPVLTVGEVGAVEVAWDGGTTDFAKPLVHGHVEVLVALSDAGVEPSEADYHRASSIRDRDGGATTIACPTPGAWFVRLRMVGQDRVTKGAFSEASSAVVVALVETEGMKAVLADARARQDAAQAELDAAVERVQGLEDDWTNADLPALRQELAAAKDAVAAAEGRLTAAEGRIADGEAGLDDARDTLAASLIRLSDAEGEIDQAVGRVTDLEADWVEANFPALRQNLADARLAVTEAEDRLELAEGRVSDTEADLGDLRLSRLPALDARLDGISDTVDDYDGRITAAQTGADSANTTANTLRDTTLPALEGRLVENETAIGEAEGRIDGVRDVTENLRDTRLPALEESLSTGLVDANEWRVDGWIEARHIMAESVAGAVGEFLQLSATQIDTVGLAAYLADILELNASQITAGTISTELLDAQSVAAAVANFLTLDALEINVGELAGQIANVIQITSESIVSGAITTRHLAIGDYQNYLPVEALSDYRINGLASPMWSGVSQNANGWRTTDTQGGMPVALRWNGPVPENTGDSRLGYRLGGKGMNVRPGEQIRLTGYGWRGVGQPGNVGVRFVFRDDNGTLLAWGPSGAGHLFAAGWQHFEMKATVPANDAIRYVTIDFYAQANSNQGHWGNFKWSRMVSGELIVDGTVSARHIMAESVAGAVGEFLELNADQITAGTISADRLDVSDLAARIATVVELNADRITAGKLAAERVDIADLFADQAFIAELRAGVVEAIQVTAERIITGNLIATGTIDSSHVNAESVAAGIGQFVKINANQMTAGTIDTARLNVTTLAASIATIVQLDADRITTGKFNADRVNIASLYANEGFISRLRAGVVEAIQVTTERIITGDIVATGTIDVSHINVTEELTAAIGQFLVIRTNQLEANAIDGMSITAGTFQTQHETNRGVKLQPSGLRGWDATGSLNFELDTSGHLNAQEANVEGRFQAGFGDSRAEIDQGSITYYSPINGVNRTLTGVPFLKFTTPDGAGGVTEPVIAAKPTGGMVLSSGRNSPEFGRSVVEIDGHLNALGGDFTSHVNTTSVYASIGITGIGTNNQQLGGLVSSGVRTRLQGRTSDSHGARDMYVRGVSPGFSLTGSDSIMRMNFTYGEPTPTGDRVPQVTSTCQLGDNTSGRIAALTVGNISQFGFQCTARPVGGGSPVSYNIVYDALWR